MIYILTTDEIFIISGQYCILKDKKLFALYVKEWCKGSQLNCCSIEVTTC